MASVTDAGAVQSVRADLGSVSLHGMSFCYSRLLSPDAGAMQSVRADLGSVSLHGMSFCYSRLLSHHPVFTVTLSESLPTGSRKTRSGRNFSPYHISSPNCTVWNYLERFATDSQRPEISEDPGDDSGCISESDGEDVSHTLQQVVIPDSQFYPKALLPPPVAPPVTAPSSAAAAASSGSVKNRNAAKKKRARRNAQEHDAGEKACKARRIQETARRQVPIHGVAVDEDFDDYLTNTRWTAARKKKTHRDEPTPPAWPPSGIYTPEELEEEFGMEKIPYTELGAKILTDFDDRAIGLLPFKPRESQRWDREVTLPATNAIANAAAALRFSPKHVTPRRGQFHAISAGISHGGGQTHPMLLSQTPHNAAILNTLFSSRPFERISGFTNDMFRTYAPRLHGYYSDTLDSLHTDDNALIPPMKGSAFAACTINFGPQTVTAAHRDFGNLPWGWCSVTALGDYDYELGGHIVLWDVNRFAEFPPGATTTLPSAILHHSNTPIAAHETRYSVAQYSAGSLFRWVNNGLQSEENWNYAATPEDLTQRVRETRDRWARGVEMLSTIDELL